MSSATRPHTVPLPPDQRERERALDPGRSILVQAPAGSGKTDLLTRRFLRLLSQVEDPGQIVAITFTRAAAAEMRHRILSELEKAMARQPGMHGQEEFSMELLAERAFHRSRALGWDLLKMPSQLRISTIDSFCRELALQEPLLSGLGGGLDVTENATEIYRRAARRTLEQIGNPDSDLSAPALNPAIEKLLIWRDGWRDLESLLATMLAQRDRWMQDFVVAGIPDWDALREKLERPFARVVEASVHELDQCFDQETRDEAMDLARFACGQRNKWKQCRLIQIQGQPCRPFSGTQELEQARQGYICLADLLLTKEGTLRKSVNVTLGFPKESPEEKLRIVQMLDHLRSVPGMEERLDAMRKIPPARYPEEDWQIVRACFTLLRHAVAELRVAFAEAGAVDFPEISQVALGVLRGEDGLPTDAALKTADKIHHLLIDEFQDTSRRQYRIINSLVAAWPDTVGRSLFVVGDPMQSVYFFRDADAELFSRVRKLGFELPDADPLQLEFVPLSSNFRTTPKLVDELNEVFTGIFAADDGSVIEFTPAEAARQREPIPEPRLSLHIDFIPQTVKALASDQDTLRRKQETAERRVAIHEKQTSEIVELIRGFNERIEAARARGDKFRIAILGRTYAALKPIAAALREAAIYFRAVDLENLGERPEVQDALAMTRALLNPEDRVAWLGVLRAPWAGLSLGDVHILAGADDPMLLRRPLPDLISERLNLLSAYGQTAAERVTEAFRMARTLRAAEPSASLGAWLEQVWLSLGGADCVDSAGRANLELLWKRIDMLDNGEVDLFGPGLDAALADLNALPDPAASSDYGVQLMSIHKSKGLEFEVVIVPELEAGCRRGEYRLLSWLERGLESTDESGDVTEFLVAPVQSKGAESGKCKSWVDRIYREREAQEMRRILYVSATRAREELHLFARPEYKSGQTGGYTLCDPRDSLLATAWPALGQEIRRRFDQWVNVPEDSEIDAIAASHAGNVIEMGRLTRPAIVRRLPIDYVPSQAAIVPAQPVDEITGPGNSQLYQRHEGGAVSRALGSAVHLLLEHLAYLRTMHEWPEAREALRTTRPMVVARLRSVGLDERQADRVAAQAMDIAISASRESAGQWILAPHPDAASEVRWAGIISGALHEVRVDRIFRAGPTVGSEGGDCWWIVDYKSANQNASDSESLLKLRSVFAPQLELYAQVLRNIHGRKAAIRGGLYYPRMLAFDSWDL